MSALIRDLLPFQSTQVITSFQADVEVLADGSLALCYLISVATNSLAQLRIKDVQRRGRVDGLWQHTCFEAFIRAEGESAYREFNFAPSGAWQAYVFADYRQGVCLEPASDPCVETMSSAQQFILRAVIQAADLPPGPRLQLGLTAVVEGTNGGLTYWALKHAADKPDFHHPDSFVLEINTTCE